MALCKNGLHELTEPGPCGECRRAHQREYRRAKRAAELKVQRDSCTKGHPYTEATSRWCVRQGHRYRMCLLCQRESFGATMRGEPGRPAVSSVGSDTERTRLLLWLDEMREREMRADLRLALVQRIATLQA